MTIRKNTLIAACAAMAAACGTASAAVGFIYHDSATTDGGEFNASYVIGNLRTGDLTSSTDTENTAEINQSYATRNPPTGGFPVTITLNFNEAVNLTDFYVWNHSNNNAGETNGMGSFTLTFFDAVSGGGTQIGAAYNGTAVATTSADNTGYGAQAFDFGTTYAGVRSVELLINNKVGGITSGFVAIREIGFEAIPEPGSSLLLGLGSLALLRRRR
jgi:hypothetical protein